MKLCKEETFHNLKWWNFLEALRTTKDEFEPKDQILIIIGENI